MATVAATDARLGRQLILDEIFELSLYRALRGAATGDLRRVLDELIVVEVTYAIGLLAKAVWGIAI
jgi:hypothetical protein